MTLSSALLDRAVDQLATLPGIGRRTAMRLALDLLRREPHDVPLQRSHTPDARGGALLRHVLQHQRRTACHLPETRAAMPR
jgi:Holliday junction resolvasome RuvABC DNA-binding subunit